LAPSGRGGCALRVVVDTNVWVSGLILPDSTPGLVIQAVRDRRVTAVASWDLGEELALVLRRPKFRRYRISDADVGEVLALLAPLLPAVEIDLPVRDPKDAPVVAAALGGRADAIVTGDRDLIDDHDLRRSLNDRGIQVVTPRELLALLGPTPSHRRA
jgi:putative PIN family toxin of toxin-antitoxin system